MKLINKIFRDESTVELKVIELWEVRWMARYGEYSSSVEPVAEFFTSEEDALRFAGAIKDAFRLIKHTSGDKVSVNKKRVS